MSPQKQAGLSLESFVARAPNHEPVQDLQALTELGRGRSILANATRCLFRVGSFSSNRFTRLSFGVGSRCRVLGFRGLGCRVQYLKRCYPLVS